MEHCWVENGIQNLMNILKWIGHIFGYYIKGNQTNQSGTIMVYGTVVENLNESNETILFHNSILGNYWFDT